MDHELMTMWLSVDPMADKYPGLSPYNYCAWNPVELVDPDGRDNVIYLVDLQKQKNIDVDKLINRANEVLESLGLNTRVRLAPDGKFFDPQFMDPTDPYAVLGDIGDVKEFISKYNPEYCDESFNEFTGFANSPEWAANEYFDKADAIGLSSKGIVDCATNFFGEKDGVNMGAFLLLHAAGHNAGLNHSDQTPRRFKQGVNNCEIMFSGQWTYNQYTKKHTKITSYFSKSGNSKYIELMNEKFGGRPARDNYRKNQYIDITTICGRSGFPKL